MDLLPNRELHSELGAAFGEVAGCECVRHYGDLPAEHAALTRSAGVMDLSLRGRICLVGADRATFLHGQVTNDIKRLTPGQGCRALVVTSKGRIEGDLGVWNLGDELLLDFDPGQTATITARLEKFLVADDVQLVDVASLYSHLTVQGPKAGDAVAALELFSPAQLESAVAPWSFASDNDSMLGQVYAMNRPRLGSAGFDLFIPVAAVGVVFDKLIAAAKHLGGGVCGEESFEVARVEAGLPKFGAELDESVLPPEAGLDAGVVSYTKGCYIGQEVLNRIRTVGRVNRCLAGLRFSAGTALPPTGSVLTFNGKEVGAVTSAVNSIQFGVPVALALVRREAAVEGTALTLAEGSVATVSAISV